MPSTGYIFVFNCPYVYIIKFLRIMYFVYIQIFNFNKTITIENYLYSLDHNSIVEQQQGIFPIQSKNLRETFYCKGKNI